ncbi:MAG: ABC transporter ATP-binding protein [Rhodospirillales bacterium]|nr:ABC transporter ATP-binding protein [Rhodospirillales bacterium]MDE2198955.1 ABC transporter ATP-binding protein [Rhodospirillales bacterium]MDE2575100.1 ABC transporter ATP-binding protein [Rhodospirillales bacterium]
MGVALLAARGLVGGYGAAEEILKGCELAVAPGELVAIIGPNGAGKSTLLKAIAGLLRLNAGTILLDGTEITALPARARARAGIAFVPQEANVFPTMNVRENLEMGGFLEPRAARGRIEALYARFPVLAEKRRAAARTLSGGQRQVLAMGMALMVKPRLLLLDEPSAGLSPKAAEGLFDAIAAIHAEGTAIAMVEQNASEALAIADRGVVLVNGASVHSGPARALAADPEMRRLFLGG